MNIYKYLLKGLGFITFYLPLLTCHAENSDTMCLNCNLYFSLHVCDYMVCMCMTVFSTLHENIGLLSTNQMI